MKTTIRENPKEVFQAWLLMVCLFAVCTSVSVVCWLKVICMVNSMFGGF